MSAEDWEMFKEHRQMQQQRKLYVWEEFKRKFHELDTVCWNIGLFCQIQEDSRQVVIRRGVGQRVEIQYWPTSNKWQVTSTGKVYHGNISSFVKFLTGWVGG